MGLGAKPDFADSEQGRHEMTEMTGEPEAPRHFIFIFIRPYCTVLLFCPSKVGVDEYGTIEIAKKYT